MHYLTIGGFALGSFLLGAVPQAAAQDGIWGMTFYDDTSCGYSPAAYGDSVTWDCYNLESASDLVSYKFEADDCEFTALVSYEADCADSDLAMSSVCTAANTLKGNAFKSFLVMGPLANNC